MPMTALEFMRALSVISQTRCPILFAARGSRRKFTAPLQWTDLHSDEGHFVFPEAWWKEHHLVIPATDVSLLLGEDSLPAPIDTTPAGLDYHTVNATLHQERLAFYAAVSFNLTDYKKSIRLVDRCVMEFKGESPYFHFVLGTEIHITL